MLTNCCLLGFIYLSLKGSNPIVILFQKGSNPIVILFHAVRHINGASWCLLLIPWSRPQLWIACNYLLLLILGEMYKWRKFTRFWRTCSNSNCLLPRVRAEPVILAIFEILLAYNSSDVIAHNTIIFNPHMTFSLWSMNSLHVVKSSLSDKEPWHLDRQGFLIFLYYSNSRII